MKEYWKHLFLFIRYPNISKENEALNNKFGLKQLLLFYLMYLQVLLATSIILALSNIILKQVGVNLLRNALLNNKEITNQLNGLQYFILVGVIAPVYEELIFRNYLKLNKNTIAISLAVYVFIFYGPILPFKSLFISGLLLRILFSIIAFILVETLIKGRWIIVIKKKYFRYVFYFSILIFGFYHIFNFSPINLIILLFSPILVIPQLFAAVLFGYIRIKNGIKWSIGLHILINVVAILIEFI